MSTFLIAQVIGNSTHIYDAAGWMDGWMDGQIDEGTYLSLEGSISP